MQADWNHKHFQSGKFQMKSRVPSSTPENCLPKGAIDGSNGRESQSSAAELPKEGEKLISDNSCELALFCLPGRSLFFPGSWGAVDGGLVVPLLIPEDFAQAAKLHRMRETCTSRSVA